MTHDEWWNGVGSGIPPLPGEDASEYMQRVIAACWPEARAAIYGAEAAQLTATLRDEIERLRAALTEARRWIGDGEFSDGLHHDYWTPEYRAAVTMVDAVLVPSACGEPGLTEPGKD